MSVVRRVLGVMPKRQFTTVVIAGLVMLFTAGCGLGANAAVNGLANPDLIAMADSAFSDGTMDPSAVRSEDLPTAPGTETILEHETLNRLATPVVKLGFYPAQAGSLLGYWSVGAIGVGPTKFWLYSVFAAAPGVAIGHVGRRVILDV